jgi:hypothetical protein
VEAEASGKGLRLVEGEVLSSNRQGAKDWNPSERRGRLQFVELGIGLENETLSDSDLYNAETNLKNLSQTASQFERNEKNSAHEVESKPDSASKKKPVLQAVVIEQSVETKETAAFPARPSQGLVRGKDPRRVEFKAAISEVFREHGWRFYWTTPGTDDKLDELLQSSPWLTVEQFGGWLQNWVASEDHTPGEHPSYFLPRIHGYSVCSADRYGRPHTAQFTDPGLTFEQFCRELEEVAKSDPSPSRVQDWEWKCAREGRGRREKILEGKRLKARGV